MLLAMATIQLELAYLQWIQEQRSLAVTLSPHFIQSGTLDKWRMSSTLRVCPLSSFSSLWKHPHDYRCFSWVILKPLKVTKLSVKKSTSVTLAPTSYSDILPEKPKAWFSFHSAHCIQSITRTLQLECVFYVIVYWKCLTWTSHSGLVEI